MNIKSYRDCAKQKVVVGDSIQEFDPVNQIPTKELGKVVRIAKQGFYVWVYTEFRDRPYWGVFTKKVI